MEFTTLRKHALNIISLFFGLHTYLGIFIVLSPVIFKVGQILFTWSPLQESLKDLCSTRILRR